MNENADSLNAAASAVEEALSSVQNMALKSAADHIKGQWQKNRMLSLKSYTFPILGPVTFSRADIEKPHQAISAHV